MNSLVQDCAWSPAPTFAWNLGRHGDRIAVVSGGEAVSYAELDQRVQALAARLGARRRLVLLTAANAIEPLVAYLAALRGGHPVILAAPDSDTNLRSLAAAYDPDVVITAADGWSIDERRPGSAHCLHPDLALLLSTSGSTGSAKLVRLSRLNLDANAGAIGTYLRLGPDDRAITTLPMQYCYGLSVINSHLHAGAGIVLTERSVVDPGFWELFETGGATSFAGVPHTFDLLDRIGFESMSLPLLRHVTQAGGRLPAASVRRFAAIGRRNGWQLFVMYGQTEATARMAYLPPALASTYPGTIGVAIPGGSFAIENPDATGVGELVYRGPNVMLGYAESPADFALGPTVDALRTGDLARLTAEGLYEIAGRSSRFVKLYGLRVDLDRLERLLADHGIGGMCIGDDAHIVVGVAEGEPSVIQSIVGDHIGIPRSRVRVMTLRQLPRLCTGKPDYVTLQHIAALQHKAAGQRAAGHRAPGQRAAATARPPGESALPAVSVAHDSLREVRAAFTHILGTEPSDDDSFVRLGGDSLSYVEMSILLEEILGGLPRDWHVTAIRDLVPVRRRPRFAGTETGVVLRALAIVLIVGTHTNLWDLAGGAHALLAVAGYNFARFSLRGASVLSKIARIAVPSMCWIGAVAAVSEEFAWPHAVLLNGLVGATDARWGYWYVEAAVQILGLLAIVLAVPAVRRLEHARPFRFALGAVAAGLAVRFDVVGLASSSHRFLRPQDVFWLFALGWAAAQAKSTRDRLLVTALGVLSIPGFFGDTQRELIVAGSLLLVLWVPQIPLPRRSTRLVGAVAGASLYIYLSHWQVYPPVVRLYGPFFATAASLVVGLIVSVMARRVIALVEDTSRRTVAAPGRPRHPARAGTARLAA